MTMMKGIKYFENKNNLFLQTSWGISCWRDQFPLLCGKIRSVVESKRIKVCKGTVVWADAYTERGEPI